MTPSFLKLSHFRSTDFVLFQQNSMDLGSHFPDLECKEFFNFLRKEDRPFKNEPVLQNEKVLLLPGPLIANFPRTFKECLNND